MEGRCALLPVAINICFAEYLNLVPSSCVTSTSLGPTSLPSPSNNLTPAFDNRRLYIPFNLRISSVYICQKIIKKKHKIMQILVPGKSLLKAKIVTFNVPYLSTMIFKSTKWIYFTNLLLQKLFPVEVNFLTQFPSIISSVLQKTELWSNYNSK